MDDKQTQNREKLFWGSIIFGITIPIGAFIAIHFGSQIEFQREQSSLAMDILFLILEWLIILAGIFLPWIIWKKLVKPFKDF